jgi:hypothetical protein
MVFVVVVVRRRRQIAESVVRIAYVRVAFVSSCFHSMSLTQVT